MSAPSLRKIKWKLFLLGRIYIPLLGYTKPQILSLTDDEVRIKIRLRRRTKNHLKSMYFGALAVGADTAAGIHAFFHAQNAGIQLAFAFKSAEMTFLKRAETDVVFVSKSGKMIADLVEKSRQTGERYNEPIEVIGYNTSHEPVATFVMTISLKVK